MDLEDKVDEIDYATDDMLEEHYLEPLYGTLSRLTYEEWRDQSTKTKAISEVWYVPQNLRMFIFNKVGIQTPEIE